MYTQKRINQKLRNKKIYIIIQIKNSKCTKNINGNELKHIKYIKICELILVLKIPHGWA